ncbi:hypothetical protein POTOM_059686 [Populus tomentosa]|uniref:Large ribosomal subunit protein uL2 C-terminal domain-containing protein n=1 Tax=Populus tomentosa TaxID=118781 RepID=A0A8X8C1T1_POPTO|nr:hypothetical protein POTOM_059686 [Populus tomentosa]
MALTMSSPPKLASDNMAFVSTCGGVDGVLSRIKLPSGVKKVVPREFRAMIGQVAGGGRTGKPLIKAGDAYNKYRHIGHAGTVGGHKVSGQKVGQIAARQTGRSEGTAALMAKKQSA